MSYGHSVRFSDFREIVARRPSVGCVNGADHVIHAGDRIGWAARAKVTCCEPCWLLWTNENAEADMFERGGSY